MSDLADRIRQITDRIQNLNKSGSEATPINQFKGALKNGYDIFIDIQSIHDGTSQAFAKMSAIEQGLKIYLFIEDLITDDIANLSYKLPNFDFKVVNSEIISIVTQIPGEDKKDEKDDKKDDKKDEKDDKKEDKKDKKEEKGVGSIRIEKISLLYSVENKQYMLNIHSNEPFTPGKIFISTSILVTPNNFDSHIIDDGPGSGGGCRPPTIQRVRNPFK